jgi:hypothetical protein
MNPTCGFVKRLIHKPYNSSEIEPLFHNVEFRRERSNVFQILLPVHITDTRQGKSTFLNTVAEAQQHNFQIQEEWREGDYRFELRDV